MYYDVKNNEGFQRILFLEIQENYHELWSDEFDPLNNGNKYMAIANPETRDYAKKFVIEDKRYKFYYKKFDSQGDQYSLTKDLNIIFLEYDIYDASLLTKKEVVDAGYDLNMFNIE